MAGTLGREVISTRQRKIAELAQREPKLTLTTLAHHIDAVWMREAYRRIRKDAAAGVDGVTAAQYEADLEANLTGLLERFKSGRYRAPAVRRVHLEKPGTSKTRPIGIPTLEDKILQRAVLMVMEAVYEQDFLDCSYGFRPGRGAHQALQALWDGLMKLGGGWVQSPDIFVLTEAPGFQGGSSLGWTSCLSCGTSLLHRGCIGAGTGWSFRR